MNLETYNYLYGNAAAGEMSKIFAADITSAEGQCAHCGSNRRFAERAFVCARARPCGPLRGVRKRRAPCR